MAMGALLSDPDASARRDEFVTRAMQALEARDLGGAYELAEEAKKGDKASLVAQIEALAAALATRARGATVDGADQRAETAAARHALALAAVQQLDGNASAQLTVEAMFMKMRSA